jgi:putative oxidoreductase
MTLFHSYYPFLHVGLLLMRIGLGISFMAHGLPKLAAGPEGWTSLGGAMANWGINFAPAFWGFAGAMAEFGGGLLLLLGLFFRPVCVVLVLTMATATMVHLKNGDSFSTLSHALEMGIVFFCLLLIGPGHYSLDFRLSKDQEINVKSPQVKT